MLVKLNTEQQEILESVRTQWRNSFLQPTFNAEAAKNQWEWVYRLCNQKKPEIIICDSPKHLKNEIKHRDIRDGLAVKTIDLLIDKKIKHKLRHEIQKKASMSVRVKVSDRFNIALYELITHTINHISIYSSFWDWLGKPKKYRSDYYGYGSALDQQDKRWGAYISFFKKIGIINNKDFDKCAELLLNSPFGTVRYRKTLFVSKPPTQMHTNSDDQLHSTTGPAVEFEDGIKQYWVRGVDFEEGDFYEIFIDDNLDLKRIFTNYSSEKCAVIVEHYGFEKLMNEVEPALIDVHFTTSQVTNKKIIYKLWEYNHLSLTVRFVEVMDHTTHQKSYICVPENQRTDTCLGAIAWTYGQTEANYKKHLRMET